MVSMLNEVSGFVLVSLLPVFSKQPLNPFTLFGHAETNSPRAYVVRSTSVSGPSGGRADGLLGADIVAKVPNCRVLIFPPQDNPTHDRRSI